MKASKDELFRFRFLTEVRFGIGIRKKIGEYIDELGVDKIALVVDGPASQSELAKETLHLIKNKTEVIELSGPEGEPQINEIEELRGKAKDFCAKAVIGFGGGSTLDMAKGLAAVLPNSKPAAEYQGFDKLEKTALPSIMIPTLFGSGAEVTPSAVMINKQRKVKGGINGRYVFPRIAVIDPELGLSAPKRVVGATALDALVHAIEGYVATCSTPLSRMYSREAAMMIFPALFKLAKDTLSVEAMGEMAFASLLAITGLMHSESGVCGAISYPLGVHHGVPHGLGGGLVMPKAIMLNSKNGCSLYSDLVPGMLKPPVGAKKLSEGISELIQAFNLAPLSKFGVTSENIPSLAEEVFSFKAVLEMNPVKIESPGVIADIIRSAV